MGIAIPQVVTPSRATGAQVIDGSLKFDKSKSQYLTRTPGSAGNRKTFTISFWRKGQTPSAVETILHAGPTLSGNSGYWDARILTSGKFGTTSGSNGFGQTSALHRDTGWYHVVIATDTTQASGSQHKIYVNGALQSLSVDYDASDVNTAINQSGVLHHIGSRFYTGGSQDSYLDSYISQYYFVDGQALGSEYFGFTDPLTNTWKPKKYEGTFGTNGFYLPMDGNSPIGQDKSGNGNDWTPVNFGGSVALDNPQVSGARPILNTTQGGTQAGFGVFGSKQNVGYAVTVYNPGGGNKYYLDGVEAPTLTGLIRGATYTFDQSDSTNGTHPLVFGTTAEGNNFNKTVTTGASAGSAGAATTITIPYDGPNTIYYHCSAHSGMGGNITGITTNEKLADQYASHCVLAVPLIGTDDDVCASIACTANNKTPTNSSVTASSTESNFYNGSHYWSANSDTLQYAEQGQELVFGTGDYTIECWVYDDDGHSGTGGRCYIFDNRIGGSVVGDPPQVVGYVDGSNEFNFGYSSGTISVTVPSTVGKWWHYAATREGTTVRFFLDGILRGSATDSTNFTNNGIGIGRATDANYGWAGYIQDFRVYRGVAKYTSNFVPASTSPDILPDTPSGVAGGSKLAKITDGAVSFDGTGDYLGLANTTDVNFGSGEFTWECFAYFHTVTGSISLMGQWENSTNRRSWLLQLNDGKMQSYLSSSGNSGGDAKQADSPANYMAANRWYHIAVTRSGDDMNLFIDGELITTTDLTGFTVYSNTDDGFSIGSQKSSASNLMNGFISNARIIKGTALYTSRFTPPTAPLTNVTNTKLLCCQSNTSATASVVDPGSSDGTGYTGNTSAITVTSASLNAGSDTNTVDGNTSTSADIRGAGSFVQLVFPQQQNGTLQVNVANGNDVGDDNIRVFIDGVEGTSFDVSSQQWYTIHTGDFTTVKLEHQGSTTGYIYGFRIGTGGDTIINASDGITANGDAAATNFNPFITDIHAVRGQETGYPTFNPLDSALTLSDGNLNSGTSGASSWKHCRASMAMTTGKFYWEYKAPNGTPDGNNGYMTGVMTNTVSLTADPNSASTGIYGRQHTTKYANGSSSTPFASASNKTIMFALDVDAGLMWTGQDGVWYNSGNPAAGTNESWSSVPAGVLPMGGSYGSSFSVEVNFGQKPFKFSPPDGFQPLNAANTRPVSVISRPNQYVGITSYRSDGNALTISGFNFQPDLVWQKQTSNSDKHFWTDCIRGAGNCFRTDTAEDEFAADAVESFTSDGWKIASGSANANQSGEAYAAWAWKAGGTPTATNTQSSGAMTANSVSVDGVLQSAYTPSGSPTIYPKKMSVGTKQGFSMVQYVGNDTLGATLPHGLTKAPDFFVTKADYDNREWQVYHQGLGNQQPIRLNTDQAAQAANAAYFNDTSPTASVVTFGNGGDANQGGATPLTYVMYAWHDVPGLQKFGTYTGNGDSGGDGPYVELGFRPALVWFKATTGTQPWNLFDSERGKINPIDEGLLINTNGSEFTGTARVDYLSNGFKVRAPSAGNPNVATTYIYCAWAEAPSVDLFGGGANAR